MVGEQLAKIVDVEKIPLNVSITPGKFGRPQNINRYEPIKFQFKQQQEQ